MNTITDKDVAQWILDEQTKSGLPGFHIHVYTNEYSPAPRFLGLVESQPKDTAAGDTLEEMLTNLRALVRTPAQLAAEKREQAAKLLAEADELLK